ncbi:acireductone synthase [Saccharothrix coeruleofusca]|uniref:Enolase-phosphatase E1 n=1 Tax=Saccharothrix coeruleofusca TaxID=33919 RepID=A0A918AKE0_9PSEU|nr:acireductone synthase [Saccharothrix coeruleofusca]MBP2333966.1 enolase-phosphatase E1 [Saccharothrix coeruleofusca]GGP44400.1 enolase-phosphatase E1 [Saccharothrix coeruleofusca]
MTEWVVLDIEGTLSATDQVLVVLYDYARPRLGPWIDEHPDDPAVREAVAQIRELSGVDGGTEELVAVLHGWMDADRKVTPLKTLQGLIWQRGYEVGDLVAELFPDVVPALREWHDDGVKLAVFSSGSVPGQVAFFGHTTEGDLTPLFEHHFDTVNAGPKREADSYRRIAAVLGSDDITFYSDVPAELHAAAEAGWRTVGVARPGEPYGDADFSPHRTVSAL